MKKVMRYICEKCKIPYASEKAARDCERDCREKEIEKKNKKAIEKEKEEALERLRDSVRMEVDSINDLFPTIIKFAKEIFDLDITLRCNTFSFLEDLSNTHHCPIGGVTNWGSKPELPSGYPGYRIAFTGEVLNRKNFSLTSLFKTSMYLNGEGLGVTFRGLHFTCGGSNQGQMELFVDDFPKLKAKYKEIRSLRKSIDILGDLSNTRAKNVKDLHEKELAEDTQYQELSQKHKSLQQQAEKALTKVTQKSKELLEKVRDNYDKTHVVPAQLEKDALRYREIRGDVIL